MHAININKLSYFCFWFLHFLFHSVHLMCTPSNHEHNNNSYSSPLKRLQMTAKQPSARPLLRHQLHLNLPYPLPQHNSLDFCALPSRQRRSNRLHEIWSLPCNASKSNHDISNQKPSSSSRRVCKDFIYFSKGVCTARWNSYRVCYWSCVHTITVTITITITTVAGEN